MTYKAVIGPLVIGTVTVLGTEYLAIVNAVEVSRCNPNNNNRFVEPFSTLDDAKAYIVSFFRPETHPFVVWSQSDV
jgi:hypothetical protein